VVGQVGHPAGLGLRTLADSAVVLKVKRRQVRLEPATEFPF